MEFFSTHDLPAYAQLQHRVGHQLVQRLFQKHGCNTPVSDTRMSRSPFGKPYIPQHPHFSISHSAQVVVAALYIYGPIGIDVEYRRGNTPDFRGIFTTAEEQYLATIPNPSDYALSLWVKKESIAKADGRGLQIPFSNITLDTNAGTVTDDDTLWHLHPVDIIDHYCYVSCRDAIQRLEVEAIHKRDVGV